MFSWKGYLCSSRDLVGGLQEIFRDVFPWKAGLLTFSPMQSAVTPSPTTCPNETQQQKKTARTKIVSAQSVIWLWVSRRYFRMISPISGLLTLLTAASRRHTFSADPPAQTHDDNIIENGPHKAPLSAQAASGGGSRRYCETLPGKRACYRTFLLCVLQPLKLYSGEDFEEIFCDTFPESGFHL